METRSTHTAPTIEERADDGPRITGLGAVFFREGDPGTEYKLFDDMIERIMPGTFDRAVREDDVRSMFNHDVNQLLGRNKAGTLALSVEDVGLRYTAQPPESRSDVVDAIRRGDVSGSSFMFEVTDVTWRETDEILYREIRGVRLFEVGPVVFPAYEAATSEVKSVAENGAERHRKLLLEAELHGICPAGKTAIEILRRRNQLRSRKMNA